MSSLGSFAKACDACVFSLSLYGAGQVVEFAQSDAEATCCEKYTRIGVAEIGYLFLLVASLAETVARAILSVVGLLALLVIPYEYRYVREAIFVVTFGGTLVSFANAAIMTSALFDNLFNNGGSLGYDDFSFSSSCDSIGKTASAWLFEQFQPPRSPMPAESYL